MQTITFNAGSHIEDVAATLVANAPARTDFNGITLRARYATTQARDIVAHMIWRSDLRSIAYQHSPAGKRTALDAEANRAVAQVTIDAHVRLLLDLDFSSVDVVLAWVAGIADASDHVGVRLNRAGLREMFENGGWPVGVNCGADFNADDERNFAGWIVGQWLDCWHPMVSGFVEQWRAKFRVIQ